VGGDLRDLRDAGGPWPGCAIGSEALYLAEGRVRAQGAAGGAGRGRRLAVAQDKGDRVSRPQVQGGRSGPPRAAVPGARRGAAGANRVQIPYSACQIAQTVSCWARWPCGPGSHVARPLLPARCFDAPAVASSREFQQRCRTKAPPGYAPSASPRDRNLSSRGSCASRCLRPPMKGPACALHCSCVLELLLCVVEESPWLSSVCARIARGVFQRSKRVPRAERTPD
jgi:hypothetical protein